MMLISKSLIFLLCWAALQQSSPVQHSGTKQSIPNRALVVTQSKDLGTPNFSFFGRPQCDAFENLYFHLNRGNFNDPTILRLRTGTGEPTIFQSKPDDETAFSSFFANSHGEVFVIVENSLGEVRVRPFSSDAKPADEIKLSTPAFLEPKDFAVSRHGYIFVSGLFNDGAAKYLIGKSYAGIFDPSGRLVRVFKRISANPNAEDEWTSGHHEGSVTVGSDDRFYVLQWDSLLVVSQLGKLIRKIKLEKPEPSMRANGVVVSDGIAAIEYIKSDQDSRITAKYLLLDIDSKAAIAIYEPEQNIRRLAACFTRSDGFVFTRSFEGHIRIDRAEAR